VTADDRRSRRRSNLDAAPCGRRALGRLRVLARSERPVSVPAAADSRGAVRRSRADSIRFVPAGLQQRSRRRSRTALPCADPVLPIAAARTRSQAHRLPCLLTKIFNDTQSRADCSRIPAIRPASARPERTEARGQTNGGFCSARLRSSVFSVSYRFLRTLRYLGQMSMRTELIAAAMAGIVFVASIAADSPRLRRKRQCRTGVLG
jgi:hypothetical protein